MRHHLKRISAPKTWLLNRKEETFTIHPHPSGHPRDQGLPLGLFLRDHLHLARTSSEVKKLLDRQAIEVDGIRRHDHRYLVGLFDIITIPSLKRSYVVCFDAKGRVTLQVAAAASVQEKVCKVVGKNMVKGKKIQYTFHDGKNLQSEMSLVPGDSAILQLPQVSIKEHLPLQVGARVYIMKGPHQGDIGILKELRKSEALYEIQEKIITTTKASLFVLPEHHFLISSPSPHHHQPTPGGAAHG